MDFFVEWTLAVHRAVWFPVFWAMGLERPAMEAPIDLTPTAKRKVVPISRAARTRTSTAKKAAA
jgi:hypothetical protein